MTIKNYGIIGDNNTQNISGNVGDGNIIVSDTTKNKIVEELEKLKLEIESLKDLEEDDRNICLEEIEKIDINDESGIKKSLKIVSKFVGGAAQVATIISGIIALLG